MRKSNWSHEEEQQLIYLRKKTNPESFDDIAKIMGKTKSSVKAKWDSIANGYDKRNDNIAPIQPWDKPKHEGRFEKALCKLRGLYKYDKKMNSYFYRGRYVSVIKLIEEAESL